MSAHSDTFKFAIKPNKPLLIAGPCSAETEEQVIQLAQAIQANCPQVSLLRAGIWKPRTRPNSFEGIGEKGLAWLKKASRITKLPVCTEVAKAGHVEAALKAEIDVLWIGARSTVSPFIMQEIADALRGVDIPVMVKNPINPDLALWLGGIERIQQAGIKEIAAIHRGFSSYNTSKYRNVPNWEIPIELKRQAPNLPLICDPSHIGGRKELVAPLAQQAVNLQFDGLMIETHLEPQKAWSDAEQQITPDALGHLIASLSTPLKEASQEEEYPRLDTYRQEIDRLDNYILELLAERMNIAGEIGNYKKQERIAIHQPKRWADTVKRALEVGETNGLSKAFILELFQKIHNESIERQAKN
jgi:chorismate mutase